MIEKRRSVSLPSESWRRPCAFDSPSDRERHEINQDADYCKALTQKYEAYISNMSVGRSPGPGTVDGSVAIAQCKDGNTAAGIPVLERKLRDARIDLPPRG